MVIPDNLDLQMVKKLQILVFAKTLALFRVSTSFKEHEKICLRIVHAHLYNKVQ
jgi:hypothetical protein